MCFVVLWGGYIWYQAFGPMLFRKHSPPFDFEMFVTSFGVAID